MTEEQLKVEIPTLTVEANKYITFRVFKLKKGWDAEHITELYRMKNWLTEVIRLGEEIKVIYNRHPKEVWERFKSWSIKGLTEQTELNKRTQKLEEFVNKNKPPFIAKAKPAKGLALSENN